MHADPCLLAQADPGPLAPPPKAMPVVLGCAPALMNRVRYVFDSLFLAAGIPLIYVDAPPSDGPWLSYGGPPPEGPRGAGCLAVVHSASAWTVFDEDRLADAAVERHGLHLVLPEGDERFDPSTQIDFDLAANAFYFLSSWAERIASRRGSLRHLHADSEFVRLGVPQDIVDRYLERLRERLCALCERTGVPMWPSLAWPDGSSFAVVLSHDVDFLPVRPLDNVVQGAKTVLRHLVRQRDPADAWRAARGWVDARIEGRDPYGCVPEIIEREQALGVRSSFAVAVGHRHPNDVNYHVDSAAVRDYLQAINAAGFDLCLHGSVRSTENPQWYVDEAEMLTLHLGRPVGSRQHFLSFDYDRLFEAQERAGIRYDMSIGFPDHPGPRAGCSFPYFPYNLRDDRPYRVLEICLFLMDVTLRGYLGLRPQPARRLIDESLQSLQARRGCASVVWHPIVFGGARDPGYDRLYWDMVERIGELGGLATDGRTVDAFWRERALAYPSFA